MANVTRGPLYIRPSTHRGKWRGAQLELKTPLPIAILSNRDGAGSVSGEGYAGTSGAFQHDAFQNDAFQPGINADSIVFPFATRNDGQREIRPARAVKLGRGAQVEFQNPTPLRIINNRDGDGVASGDAIASATATSIADSVGAASGDAITSATGDSLADAAGAASGDANASAVGDSTAFSFSEWTELLLRRGPGKAVKLGRGAQIEFQSPITLTGVQVSFGDAPGSAIGDAVAIATGDSLADAVGAATGDAIASATGDALSDASGAATGDAIAAATGDSTAFDFSVWAEVLLRRQTGKLPKLGRGPQIDVQVPTPIRAFTPIASFADADGLAIGDATASAEGYGLGYDAGDGEAFGDSTAFGFSDARRRAVKVIHSREVSARIRTSVGSRRSATTALPSRSLTDVFSSQAGSLVFDISVFDSNVFDSAGKQKQRQNTILSSNRSNTEINP